MDHAAFWTELHARVTKYDLLCHPFYQAWSRGELTREELREYASHYYHHVAAFPGYLERFGSRLRDRVALDTAVAENRADELGVGSSDGRAHDELWLDFAEGMGADRGNASGSVPVPEVAALIARFRSVAESGTPAEVLAAFYAYESQVPRVAETKLRGLRDQYGADEKTCGYFALHRTADVRHADIWRQCVDAELDRSPEQAQAALAAAEGAAEALWAALDGIERERVARRLAA